MEIKHIEWPFKRENSTSEETRPQVISAQPKPFSPIWPHSLCSGMDLMVSEKLLPRQDSFLKSSWKSWILWALNLQLIAKTISTLWPSKFKNPVFHQPTSLCQNSINMVWISEKLTITSCLCHLMKLPPFMTSKRLLKSSSASRRDRSRPRNSCLQRFLNQRNIRQCLTTSEEAATFCSNTSSPWSFQKQTWCDIFRDYVKKM